uniref:Uncharacterized protein n=1 Tax=Clytia hemisphaerica TaxID=252671 RepID=A0A7M5XG22_9CNID
VIAFRFVIANVAGQIVVSKVASIKKNGSSVPSATSDDDSVRCRLIPLKETEEGSFIFDFPEALVITSELKASHILEEIAMKPVNENESKKSFQILPHFKKRLTDRRNELNESNDFAVAKQVSKSLVPLEFQEVENITKQKLDPKSHEYLYHVKFKNSEETAWLNYSCFDRPVRYSNRSGITTPLFADVTKMNDQEGGQGKKRQISLETSISCKP